MPQDEVVLTFEIHNKSGYDDINIAFDDGIAQNAFSQDTLINYLMLIFFSLLMLIEFLFIIKMLREDYSISELNYRADSFVKRKKKPLLLSEKRWKTLKIDSILYLLRDHWYSSDIERDNNIFKLMLADDFFEGFTDSEQQTLFNQAKKEFNRQLTDKINSRYIYDIDDLNKLKQLSEGPFSIFINDDVLENAQHSYMRHFISRNYVKWPESIDDFERPNLIKESIWDEYITVLKALYKAAIFTRAFEYDNVSIACLNDFNLDFLGNGKNIVQNIIYKCVLSNLLLETITGYQYDIYPPYPEWIKTDDTALINKIITFRLKESILKDTLQHGYAPDNMRRIETIEEFRPFIDTINTIISMYSKEAELDDKLLEVRSEALALNQDRQKILRQLEIINTLFADPTIIDRIQEYDVSFSNANYEVLKKLSVYLANQPNLN